MDANSGTSFIPKKVLGKFMQVYSQPLRRPGGGKTLVFFMGAVFCAFFASERWAIVSALTNFGSSEGLVETTSADHASTVGRAIKIEVDNIAALVCKSIGDKADACNVDALKSLADKI
jgi:hypothetical protein